MAENEASFSKDSRGDRGASEATSLTAVCLAMASGFEPGTSLKDFVAVDLSNEQSRPSLFAS